MLSDPIGCNQAGRAQQTLPQGATTARDDEHEAAVAAGELPELRWVGAQHLMHGYCGRAPDGAAGGDAAHAAGRQGGARAYGVRPALPAQRPRHLVVRVGPRPALAAGGGAGEGRGETETRARAA